jgi:hypothetical protein
MKETPILTPQEKIAIRSMARHWREVLERDDKSPLDFELRWIINFLGVKILWIVEEYVNREAKP